LKALFFQTTRERNDDRNRWGRELRDKGRDNGKRARPIRRRTSFRRENLQGAALEVEHDSGDNGVSLEGHRQIRSIFRKGTLDEGGELICIPDLQRRAETISNPVHRKTPARIRIGFDPGPDRTWIEHPINSVVQRLLSRTQNWRERDWRFLEAGKAFRELLQANLGLLLSSKGVAWQSPFCAPGEGRAGKRKQQGGYGYRMQRYGPS